MFEKTDEALAKVIPALAKAITGYYKAKTEETEADTEGSRAYTEETRQRIANVGGAMPFTDEEVSKLEAEAPPKAEPAPEKPKAEKPKAEKPKAEKPKAEKPKAEPEDDLKERYKVVGQAAVALAAAQGSSDGAKAILQEFGVEKVGQLDPEKLPDALAAFRKAMAQEAF